MAHLSLSFLGRFSVLLDAEPVTAFGSEKVRALLAYLAVESAHAHRRTALTAMFWPDSTDKKAAHSLSQTLLRLRQALREKDYPDSFLVVTPQDVQFKYWGDCQLDVVRFRELFHLASQHVHAAGSPCEVCAQWLAQAVELYQGDLLAGLFVADSVAFEEWRVVQQEKLHGQALEMLTRLADYHEQRQEFDRVQNYARRLISLEPWHEAAHLQIMRALVQSGQHSAAMRQYEVYQRALAETLGIKPSAELTQLYKQIHEDTSAPGTEAGPGEDPWLSRQGERKQVTALVCNLGAEYDPERFEDQVMVCERHCKNIFHRFGGRRVLRHGGACLTYFGYPLAYEDAARRAVHSGLAVAATLKEHGYEQVRIGIHTGIMMVGESRGQNLMDRDLVGNTPDIARDCQRLAPVGTVLITEPTQHLIQDSFEFQPLEISKAHPGVPYPLYQVQGEKGTPGRLDWLAQTQRLTPFIGRTDEMTYLSGLLKKVRQGQGQVVLLTGEPGIGKSRLLWELRDHALSQTEATVSTPGQRPFLWFTSKCLPHYQNTSLYPIIGLLENILQFQPSDSGEVKREKLADLLAGYGFNHPSTLWLLSIFLNLPTGTPAPETITPSQREQIRQLLVALLQKFATEQPLVIGLEDLHWSDPTTIDWIGQSLASLASVPCLVLFTARPEFRFPPELPLHTRALAPLWREQALQMVTNLTGEALMDEETRQHIVTQTDGIPLFIEELTKSLLEQPMRKNALQKDTAIPHTLRDSLSARLDHLGPAKETAQWASLLGREFSYPILRACLPFDEGRLQSDLARLIVAELISPLYIASPHQPSNVPERYLFRHALVQEAAYASMLRRTRQVSHRRVAEIIETRFPQIAETQPEVLAEQYASANLPTRAITYWLRAGERATAQGATLEARNFYERALKLVEPDDLQRRWQVLLGRESVFNFRGERDAQKADIAALLDLAESLDDDERRAQAWICQARYASSKADFHGQLDSAEAAILAADRANAPVLEGEALAHKITALLRLGERTEVKKIVEKTLALTQNLADPHIQAYAWAAIAIFYIEIGDLVMAVRFLKQSLEAAQVSKVRHLDLESQYYGHLGFAYLQLGLYAEAQQALEKGLELANLMQVGRFQAYLRVNLGVVHWRLFHLDVAVQMEEQALREYSLTGEVFGQAACHAYLGYIYEAMQVWDRAAHHLQEACHSFAELEVDPDKYEAQAAQARVALAQGRLDKACDLATQVWQYLSAHGTEGLNSPAWVYLCLIDVFEKLEVPEITVAQIVETGYRELCRKADMIHEADWRKSFLENVAENKILVEKWHHQRG